MDIEYFINESIEPNEFIEVLRESGLGDRRPIDDYTCISGMLKNSNLLITARDKKKIVGIARSMTDFHYACYLSDLAVHKKYHNLGIGKELQRITQSKLGLNCKLILLAAPEANGYYHKIGFSHHLRCWVLDREETIG